MITDVSGRLPGPPTTAKRRHWRRSILSITAAPQPRRSNQPDITANVPVRATIGYLYTRLYEYPIIIVLNAGHLVRCVELGLLMIPRSPRLWTAALCTGAP